MDGKQVSKCVRLILGSGELKKKIRQGHATHFGTHDGLSQTLAGGFVERPKQDIKLAVVYIGFHRLNLRECNKAQG